MTTESIEKPTAVTPTPEKHFRIVGLKVSNVKKIRAIEFSPVGDVITVGGKNGAGKSSLLDSIFYTLAGADAVCDRPIRDGQQEGKSFVDLGEINVTKIWNASGTTKLKVAMRDGTPISSPQTILDRLCSLRAFDPMYFVSEKPDKQLETLRKLVGLDFTSLNKKREEVYDTRTQVNRDIAAKKAQLLAKPFHEDAPAEEVSVKSLMAELSLLRAKNRNNDSVKEDQKNAALLVHNQRHDVAVCQQQIDELLKQIEEKRAEKAKMEIDLAGLEATNDAKFKAVTALVYEDDQPIVNRISDADSTNAKVRANGDHNRLKGEIEGLEKQEREHTQHIERIDAEKRDKLENAKFPTPGLSFSESGVLLEGLPFDQANTAAQIRASMEIAIAMNPKLRVVFVRNGSLVGKEGHEQILQTAKEKQIQVWTEMLTEDDKEDSKCSVIIEDGNARPPKPYMPKTLSDTPEEA